MILSVFFQSPTRISPQKEVAQKPEELFAKFKKIADDGSNVSSAGDSDSSGIFCS